MSSVTEQVPFGDNPEETAVLLLAAAEELGMGPEVVKTSGRGGFVVPAEVNEKAFGKQGAKKSAEKKAEPAKKAAAKKAPAKKAAKKSTAKKSTAKKAQE